LLMSYGWVYLFLFTGYNIEIEVYSMAPIKGPFFSSNQGKI